MFGAIDTGYAQCAPQWLPGVGIAGAGPSNFATGGVEASVLWDPDGAGPQSVRLVVAGRFDVVGTQRIRNVASWDLATGQWFDHGIDGRVASLLVSAAGDLLVSGNLTVASGAGIARWNGNAWTAVCPVPTGGLFSTPGANSFVEMQSGDLLMATGVGNTTGIVRWNGTALVPFATFASAVPFFGPSIGMLQWLSNGDLLVTGSFSSVAGVPANGIARWDGSQWHSYAGGIAAPGSVGVSSGTVNFALPLPNGELLAFGQLDPALGGVANAARWNGTSWVSLGSGGPVTAKTALQLPNGDVLAVGQVGTGLFAPLAFARWDGTAWSPFPGATSATVVAKLQSLPNGDIVALGRFHEIGGVGANNLARWDGASWHPLLPGAAAPVLSFLLAANGDSFAGGTFRELGGIAANAVARRVGGVWGPLGGGIEGGAPATEVTTMVQLPNGDLVVAGEFTMAGGAPANRVARWDGTAWHPLGTGVNSFVSALAVLLNGDVVATGAFTTAGGAPANRIARWDGATWHPLGSGLTGPSGAERGNALLVLPNGDLVVGGSFGFAGGLPAGSVARWDGASWSAMGTLPGTLPVAALALLPNGRPVAAAGTVSEFLPSGWVPYPATSLSSIVALAVLADGSLVAAGNGVVRWNGASWSVLDPMDVRTVVPLPSGELLAGGNFAIAGNQIAAYSAVLAPVCPATVTSYGAGCIGSGGANVLAAGRGAWNAATFLARATGMPAQGIAIVAYGFAPLALPWSSLHPAGVPGCDLLVTDEVLQLASLHAGVVDTEIAVLPTPSLVGVQFFHQVMAVETGAAGIVAITATNGLSLVVGSY